LLLVPVLAGVIALGPGWSVLLLVVLATAAALAELSELLLAAASRGLRAITFGLGLLLPLGAYLAGISGLAAATALVLFLNIAIFLLHYPSRDNVIHFLGSTTFAHLYLSFMLAHIVLLYHLPEGRSWVFFVLAVIFAGDTGAYYIGHRWGRHKLAPTLSPGKTMEGALGGLLCSLVVGFIAAETFFSALEVTIWPMLLLAGVLALVGQLGDLIESMLKRVCRVKDASRLLPGHGGLLDRLDSLLFSFPLAYYGSLLLSHFSSRL